MVDGMIISLKKENIQTRPCASQSLLLHRIISGWKCVSLDENFGAAHLCKRPETSTITVWRMSFPQRAVESG